MRGQHFQMSDIPADIAELKTRAKTAYDQMEAVWPVDDPWSAYTKRNINAFVQRVVPSGALRILNAGCGGNDYGLPPGMIAANMDISMRQCRPLPHPVVGDVEHIPFPDNSFDVTICVGAVINYVRAEVAIPELVRVTKPGGLTLVDFESSFSAEIMFSKPWAKRKSVIERLYIDHMDKTHLYSLGTCARAVRTQQQHPGAKPQLSHRDRALGAHLQESADPAGGLRDRSVHQPPAGLPRAGVEHSGRLPEGVRVAPERYFVPYMRSPTSPTPGTI